MKKKTLIWIGAGVVVLLVVILIISKHSGGYVVNLTTQASQTDTLETTVTATGEIQPVYKVEVGTQVSGRVEKLYVDYNSTVKKGSLLAELDKSTLNQQVKQSKASLSTAQSSKDLAQKNFDRVSALFKNKAATQEEYDQASAELQQAKNQVVTARSNYENALTNLKYAEIYSPIDGVVMGKEVEQGQTVASSFSTPTLFTIANDLKQMQVEADVDEADIGLVRVGQRVSFTVDAFPKDVFSGTVKQIRLDPTITSNVVTYTVIIDAPNPDEKLYPGMTANVNIIVNEQQGITIPLEATYFDPASNRDALLKEGYKLTGSAQPKTSAHATVYVVNGKEIAARQIETGLNDGANVIVTQGIKVGEKVLLSVAKEKKQKSSNKDAADNPLSMGTPKEKKR